MVEERDSQAALNRTQNPLLDSEVTLALLQDSMESDPIWINTKTTSSIEFHLKHDQKKDEIPLDQHIPAEYHEYLDIFDEEKADRFPESRTWDHEIKFKEGFQPKSFKTYNLTP